jgi:DNA-binding transcriptional regulator YiaG
MKTSRIRKLRAAGWHVGTAQEFLGLSDDEARLLRMRLGLVGAIRGARERSGLSQTELAQRMGSSQSRVAKLEAGDSSVSIDLMLRALVAAGATDADIAKALTRR